MATSRKQYEVALKQAEAELASHDARGEALRAAVEALKGLVAAAAPAKRAPARKPVRRRKPVKRKVVRRKAKAPAKRRRKSAGAGHPEVPANHYRGLGPTKAYDKFVKEFGDKYAVPQIRDALLMGGVKSSSPTSLSTGIHSVRRRRATAAKATAKTAKAAKAKKAEAKGSQGKTKS